MIAYSSYCFVRRRRRRGCYHRRLFVLADQHKSMTTRTTSTTMMRYYRSEIFAVKMMMICMLLLLSLSLNCVLEVRTGFLHVDLVPVKGRRATLTWLSSRRIDEPTLFLSVSDTVSTTEALDNL